jgi:hypothetical protein
MRTVSGLLLAGQAPSAGADEGPLPEGTGEEPAAHAEAWSPGSAAPAEDSPSDAAPGAGPAKGDAALEAVKAVLTKGALSEGTQTSPGSEGGGPLIMAWRAEGSEGCEPQTLPEPGQQEQTEAQEAATAAAAAQQQQEQQPPPPPPQQQQQQQQGTFSPFVQLEFKPRPEGPAEGAATATAAADAASAAAASTGAAPAIPAVAPPKLLARFRVNKADSMAVFMATTAEDFRDVVGLLPANSALPASDRMSYLLGRLEVLRRGRGPGCAGVPAAHHQQTDRMMPWLLGTPSTDRVHSAVADRARHLNGTGHARPPPSAHPSSPALKPPRRCRSTAPGPAACPRLSRASLPARPP